ncbi:MAG: hypothetical protein NZ700_09865 [Gemmataceae bacterium]|nr:hypothetical protein [Gemmataceae bacterium]MDW8264894.1 hypothetical protein [Gemmataceae bacterium]
MASEGTVTLPDYLQAATPNPPDKRAPWYTNTAPTYAGIFLWFVFWDQMAANGLGTGGLALALLGIVVAGVICHLWFYLVPGLLGMKTGLPLYIVGTSTFGAIGGLLMPGFLMGLLQFGWLAVNAFFSSKKLAGGDDTLAFQLLCIAWAAGAAFIGLKGIQYVAKVATFLPLIPLAVLLLALYQFGGSATSYQPSDKGDPLWAVLAMVGAIVGFFATAGAAGVDFGLNSRDRADVNLGGLTGILLAAVFTAGAATLAVAGAHAQGVLSARDPEPFTLTEALKKSLPDWERAISLGLTIAAFPGACFSSFIAANSFKTVMPRINPFITVGLGTLVSIVLAITKLAADLPAVFSVIGASFGPICGAMCADYLVAGRRWPGPRAGFNPAGWAAWLLGFIVGILPNLHKLVPAIPDVPASSVLAFLVGFLVYYGLAKFGLESQVLPYGPAQNQQTD